MAAWYDMSDDAYDRDEAFGQHVSPHAFYEWDGELSDAMAEAEILCDALDIQFESPSFRLLVEPVDRIVLLMEGEAA